MRVNDSIKTILKSPSAFITFEDAAKSVSLKQGFTPQFFCEKITAITPIAGDRIPNAMFLHKGSPLKEVFNRK